MIIGLTLAGNALSDAAPAAGVTGALAKMCIRDRPSPTGGHSTFPR